MEGDKISFSVNRNDARSLVDQMADGLRQSIVGGRYKPGDELPSSRELVSLLGVSRIVTRAALSRLVQEGYILARTGVKPIVREIGVKQWCGHVVFVSETGDENYLKTMLASTMLDSLTDGGYLFTQASVGRTKDGGCDFSHLDVALSRSVDLVLVMYHRPEINAYLAKRNVPYAVFGESASKPRTAVGTVHFDYNLAVDDFAKACKARGVKEVLEIYWHRLMCDVTPALKKAGVRIKRLKVAVDESEGRLIGVKRAGRIAFERLMADGRLARDSVYFFADDYLAEGALLSLSCAGLKAPEDVLVATWANKGLGPDYFRPLSRMEMDPFAVGRIVARSVSAYLKTGEFPAGVSVGPKWIEGETV